MKCPNKNSPEWQKLVNALGENTAWKAFIHLDGMPEDVDKFIEDYRAGITRPNFESEVLSKLHALDAISPNKVYGEYWVKKTGLYDDPKLYKPEETQRKNLQKIKELNERLGYTAVDVVKKGSGYVIRINPYKPLFSLLAQSEEDIDSQEDWLMRNVFDDTNEPITTNVLKNVAGIASDLDRTDLVDLARIIYQNLSKNKGLSIRISEDFQKDPEVSLLATTPLTAGVFSPATGVVHLNKNIMLSMSPKENLELALHEMLHGLVTYGLQKPVTHADIKFKMALDDIYKDYLKKAEATGISNKTHSFLDKEEFLASVITEPRFRERLEDIDRAFNDIGKSFWSKLLDAFLELFGIKRNNFTPKDTYGSVMDLLKDYLKNTKKVGVNFLAEEGRNYDLRFSIVGEEDRSKYSKLTDEYKEDFNARVKKQIEFLKSLSNTKSTLEAEESFGYLLGQAKKMDEGIVDQLSFFLDFVRELSIMSSTAVDKMKAIKKDTNLPTEKLYDYFRIYNTLSSYEPIFTELRKMRVSMLEGTPIRTEVDNIISNAEYVNDVYISEIFPIVSELSAEKIEEPVSKALEQMDKEILDQEEKLAKAKTEGGKNFFQKRLTKLKQEREKKFNINKEAFNDWLAGRRGDSHIATTYFESMMVNPNPVVAAAAKHTADLWSDITKDKVNELNEFQTHLDNYMEDKAGNIINASAPFRQEYERIVSWDDKGTPIKETRLALYGPYNFKHVTELQTFNYNLNVLKSKISKTEDKAERDALIKQRKEEFAKRTKFNKDYMELPYKQEVHDTMDLMDEDLGGFSARDYVIDLYDRKYQLESKLEQAGSDNEADIIFDDIDKIDFEIKRLRSEYDKTPGDADYLVAKQLRRYDDEMSKYRDFELTKRGEAKFKRDKTQIDSDFAKKKISQKERDYWYQTHVTIEYAPEYWEKKKDLLKKLEEIRTKLGITESDRTSVTALYKKIEDVVKAYRDNNRVINGLEVTTKEAAYIKDLEEQIEELKNQIEDIFGLTREEKIRISQLTDFINRLRFESFKYQASPDDPTLAPIMQSLVSMETELNGIYSKKKKLDRDLIKIYFDVVSQLADLDTTSTTHYYEDAVDNEIRKLKNRITITSFPDKFSFEGLTYEKKGDIWVKTAPTQEPEVITETDALDAIKTIKAEELLKDSDWYKKNHFKKFTFIKNQDFDEDPFSKRGDWIEQDEPIYIWRHTSPSNEKYIKYDQPSPKYKKSFIKDGRKADMPDYTNPKFKESPDGMNLPKLEGYKDDRFLNKEYFKKVASKEHSLEMKTLKFLTDKHFRAQEDIPFRLRPGWDFPSIRKSKTERVLETKAADVPGKIRGLFTGIERDFEKNEQDKDILYGYTESMSSVPVRYIGEIPIDEQSRDAFRMILMFSLEASKRKKLMEGLPYILSLYNVVSSPENKPYKLDSKNRIVTTTRRYLKKNEVLAKLIPNESSTVKQVQEIIRTFYLGEQVKEEPWSKQINTTLSYGAKLLLGLNYSAAVVNRGNAYMQSLLEAESKKGAFTLKEMFRAQAIYDLHVFELMGDLGKYGNKSFIGQFVDYFGGVNLNIINKQNKTLAYSKLVEGAGKILIPNEIAEHAIGHQLFLSCALNFKVKREGKIIPLFEAFEIKNGRFDLKPGVEFADKDRRAFMDKVRVAARRINGNYSLLDKTIAQKYAWGRLALFMNQYFVPFFQRRYGSRRFSVEEGISPEGFWRTFGRTVFGDAFRYKRNIVTNWKAYSEEERVNTIRALTELGYSITILGIFMALGGAEPDELKDNSIAANNLIFVLKMLKRQNEQFMLVPGLGLDDIYQKIKSPFPIVGKIGNLFSFVNHVLYYMGYKTGIGGIEDKDVIYTRKSAWHNEGDLKMTADLERLFGFLYRFHQMEHPADAIKNMDAYRIK